MRPNIHYITKIPILTFAIYLCVLSTSCQAVPILYQEPPMTPTSIPETMGQDDMVMVFIPEGDFLMGANDGEYNEAPEHPVYLSSYWIDKTEITNGMYLKCEYAGACKSPLADGFTAPKDFHKLPENTRLPVNYVSWYDANTYCEWAGRRLPTEAEWEKAARGTDARIYPWGDQPPTTELANFGNQFGELKRIGSFPAGASPYGVLDMAGNVWEYVSDWYDDVYYSNSAYKDPLALKPTVDRYRVLRGGGYYHQEYEIRTTFRNYTYPEYNRSGDFGFRCAADYISSPSATIAPSTQ